MQHSIAEAKADFLSGSLTLAEIARKHGIKYSALRYRAKKEGWQLCEMSDEDRANCRKERILTLSDRLLDKIEQSIKEIDRTVIKAKEKTKTVEYDYDLKKPVSENVYEKENVEVIDGMIDKMGLKQLVSTLKDIKDIQLSITENSRETDEENEYGVVVLGEVDESTLESEGEDRF